eukprot:4398296-Alexandrium_andersonii.AAC.1
MYSAHVLRTWAPHTCSAHVLRTRARCPDLLARAWTSGDSDRHTCSAHLRARMLGHLRILAGAHAPVTCVRECLDTDRHTYSAHVRDALARVRGCLDTWTV